MAIRLVESMAIDDFHHVAKVFYTASYKKKTGEEISIDFDITYLLHTQQGASKIFAFVAGDEMGIYRQHGLIDA